MIDQLQKGVNVIFTHCLKSDITTNAAQCARWMEGTQVLRPGPARSASRDLIISSSTMCIAVSLVSLRNGEQAKTCSGSMCRPTRSRSLFFSFILPFSVLVSYIYFLRAVNEPHVFAHCSQFPASSCPQSPHPHPPNDSILLLHHILHSSVIHHITP